MGAVAAKDSATTGFRRGMHSSPFGSSPFGRAEPVNALAAEGKIAEIHSPDPADFDAEQRSRRLE